MSSREDLENRGTDIEMSELLASKYQQGVFAVAIIVLVSRANREPTYHSHYGSA